MLRITRKNITYRFGEENPPVAVVKSGTVLVFETLDAHSGTVPKASAGTDVYFPDLDETNANPVTGLVYVEGARPGDTLAVRILDVQVTGQGFIPVRPKMGIIHDMSERPLARIVSVEGDRWVLNEQWSFPLRPMVGTIGTAIPGPGVPTMYPGDHGGNMDNNYVRKGATVYLPVMVPGALFGLGDVHAAMGDGEATSGGIDICAEVTVEINLVKGGGLSPYPYIEYEGMLITCGHGPDLSSAIASVTRETIKILSRQMNISTREAYQLISALGDIGIAQACNCPGVDVTTRLTIPMFWRHQEVIK
ncbi:MAG: acetamidase [Firmicutes bacterium]|nr:acetamidase [Bacillota bacterium]